MPPRWSLTDLASLDLFVSVVEMGSVSKAAAWHQISQPSASARLAKLERCLGTTLLDRGPSGSVPTESGMALVDHARGVLRAVGAFEQAARSVESEAGQRLEIVTSPIVGEYIMPRLFQASGWRSSETSVTVTNSTDVVGDLLSGRAHVGIAMCTEELDHHLSSEFIGFDDVVVVVHPKHPWTRRLRPLTPVQLASEPLVVRAERSGMRSLRGYVSHVLAPYAPAKAPAPLMELGSTNAVKSAAMEGVGPAALSRLTVHSDNDYAMMVIAYHADHRLYADEPGEMGEVTFEHIKGPWPGPAGEMP